LAIICVNNLLIRTFPTQYKRLFFCWYFRYY